MNTVYRGLEKFREVIQGKPLLAFKIFSPAPDYKELYLLGGHVTGIIQAKRFTVDGYPVDEFMQNKDTEIKNLMRMKATGKFADVDIITITTENLVIKAKNPIKITAEYDI